MCIAPRPFMVERGHDDGVGLDQSAGSAMGDAANPLLPPPFNSYPPGVLALNFGCWLHYLIDSRPLCVALF